MKAFIAFAFLVAAIVATGCKVEETTPGSSSTVVKEKTVDVPAPGSDATVKTTTTTTTG